MNRKNAFGQIDLIGATLNQIIQDYIDSFQYEVDEDGNYIYEPISSREVNSTLESASSLMLLFGSEFFMRRHIIAAFNSGANQAASSINKQLLSLFRDGSSNVDSISPETIINDLRFQREIDNYIQSSMMSMDSAVRSTISQIAAIILTSISSGVAVEEIKKRVAELIEKLKRRLKRTATTQINQANNESKMLAPVIIAAIAGVEPMVRHISALLPTTREHHAARHQKVFKVSEQRQWWASGANRINCYCSVEPVLKVSKS
jgi:hypothetical protein